MVNKLPNNAESCVSAKRYLFIEQVHCLSRFEHACVHQTVCSLETMLLVTEAFRLSAFISCIGFDYVLNCPKYCKNLGQ